MVPIELVSQGNENGVGFSLSFDQTLLGSPTVALGADAAGANLIPNNQVNQGRLGVVIGLPTGQTFTVGTRQIVTITFPITATVGSTVNLNFGDQPVVREISDANANALPTTFQNGTVTISTGFESDVAPRPNGNGSVSVTDFTQAGRFAAGLDTPAPGSEFQRADSAPRATLGGGTITVADVTQAGRYAAGLDPLTPAGGPTTPTSAFSQSLLTARDASDLFTDLNPAKPEADSVIRVVNSNVAIGGTVNVSIELVSSGNENGIGFSINFDPTKLGSPVVTIGSDAAGSTLLVNLNQSAQGRVGVIVGKSAGTTFQAGTRQIIVVRLNAVSAVAATTQITFGDQPVAREVSDMDANVLNTTFTPGNITIGTPTPATIGGRVTTPTGAGLKNAVVSLVDPLGVKRTVITNSFGVYSFSQVTTGQSYTVAVSSKRFRFAAQTMPVNANLSNVDFVGIE